MKRKRPIYFIDKLKNFENIRFHRVNSNRHNYHLLVALDCGGKRDDFI